MPGSHDWAEAGTHFHLATARDPVPPTVSHYYGFYYLLLIVENGSTAMDA